MLQRFIHFIRDHVGAASTADELGCLSCQTKGEPTLTRLLAEQRDDAQRRRVQNGLSLF